MAKQISPEEAAKKIGLPQNPKPGQSTEKGNPIADTEKITIDEARRRAKEAEEKKK